MCCTRSVDFDHADEQVPLTASRGAGGITWRAIVERAIQVVHERLLVDAVLVQRPRGFGPAERPIGPEPLVEIARQNDAGDDIGAGGLSGCQLTGET